MIVCEWSLFSIDQCFGSSLCFVGISTAGLPCRESGKFEVRFDSILLWENEMKDQYCKSYMS